MHALREGLARAAAARAVLAGSIAVLAWLAGASDTRNAIAAFLLWAFLSGGVLDRYARARATRARGFFGASGAHFGAMVRLGLMVILIAAAIQFALAPRAGNLGIWIFAVVLLSALALLTIYAQVRLVVEDRRSALGALLAAARFVRRNPASVGVYLAYWTVMWACVRVTTVLRAAASRGPADASIGLAGFLILCYLILALYASGVALFQSRLAHAGYTAAPPIEWPDSPAAEAIANASPVAP